jgi:hypothetical protein
MMTFPHPGVVFTFELSVSSADAVWRASDIEKRASVNRTLLKLVYISGVTDNHHCLRSKYSQKTRLDETEYGIDGSCH